MTRLGTLLPLLASALILGAAARAEPAASCDTRLDATLTLLDRGTAQTVDTAVSGLLDGPEAQLCLLVAGPEVAHDWFALLFHPVFLDALAAGDATRIARWSDLVTMIEAAYVPAGPEPKQADA